MEQLLLLIHQLAMSLKGPMSYCVDRSILIITERSIESSTEFTNLEAATIYNLAIKRFSDQYAELRNDIPFKVIIKKENGILLISNTLKRKEKENVRVKITSILQKKGLQTLDHLVEDDPQWFTEIIQERAKSGDPDIIELTKLIDNL